MDSLGTAVFLVRLSISLYFQHPETSAVPVYQEPSNTHANMALSANPTTPAWRTSTCILGKVITKMTTRTTFTTPTWRMTTRSMTIVNLRTANRAQLLNVPIWGDMTKPIDQGEEQESQKSLWVTRTPMAMGFIQVLHNLTWVVCACRDPQV